VSIASLETPAWLMPSVFTINAKLGRLRLDHGRLSFRETVGDRTLFDVALSDVRNVKFPFYNLGSVVRFDVAGQRYRLAFLRSERRFKWSGARLSDVRPARRWGKQWKAALKDRR
jgi:hypothetical protein